MISRKYSESFLRDADADDALMTRLCRRDESAFDELHQLYGGRVHSAIYRIVRNHLLAEDLAQDVFLKVWLQANAFEKGNSRCLGVWLVAIARNRAIDYVRSKENRVLRMSREFFAADMPVDVSNAEERLAQACQIARLTTAIAGLHDDHRRVLAQVYFEGLTHVETAQRQSRPLGTVKTWVRQALAALRHEMAEAS